MKLTEMRKTTPKNLNLTATELRTKIALKKRALALNEVTNHRELSQLKTELARVLTILKEQESTDKIISKKEEK